MLQEALVPLCALTFAVLAAPLKPSIYVGLSVASVLVTLTPLASTSVAVSGAGRLAACAWLLVAIKKQRPISMRPLRINEMATERLRAFVVVFALYAALLGWVMVNGGSGFLIVQRAVGLAVGLAFIALLLNIRVRVDRPTAWVLAATIIVSLILRMTLPESVTLQGRLTGIFANANTLGVVGVALIAILAMQIRISRTDWVGIAFAGTAIWWSGSRASAAVSVILLVLLLGHRVRSPHRILVGAAAAIVATSIYWLFRDTLAQSLLFRDTASRTEWGWAVDQFRSSPIYGVGDILTPSGKEIVSGVGSSWLTVLAWGGVVGFGILVLIAVLLLQMAAQTGYRTLIVTIGFLSHSLFESWLAVPGAPIMLLFFAVWVSAMQLDIEKPIELQARKIAGIVPWQSRSERPASSMVSSTPKCGLRSKAPVECHCSVAARLL